MKKHNRDVELYGEMKTLCHVSWPSGWTLVAPTEAFDLATEASECIAKKGEGASAISGNKEEKNKWTLGINVHARAVLAPT